MMRSQIVRRDTSARWSALFLTALLALGLWTQFALGAHADPFTSSKGYEITPADGWNTNESGLMGTDVIFLTTPVDGFAPNLTVVVTPTAPGDSLKKLPAQIRAMYPKMFPKFHITGTRFSKLGGEPSFEVTATYLQGANLRKTRMHQAIVIGGSSVFIFTCTDRDKHYPKSLNSFTTMLSSVHWTE